MTFICGVCRRGYPGSRACLDCYLAHFKGDPTLEKVALLKRVSRN